jgi:alpha-pyrone synthase
MLHDLRTLMKTRLVAIGTAVPETCLSQTASVDFMQKALQLDEKEKQKLAILYRSTGIQNRYSVIKDYGRSPDKFTFFPRNENLEPFPPISRRMEMYRCYAAKLGLQAVENCLNQLPDFDNSNVTHLITVSCTGMYAPGIDIEMVEALGLRTEVERISINFMGCYAAFVALRTANFICQAQPEAKVLVVCVELCSLHFQKKKTEDHLLANALFADGAAAALLQAESVEGKMSLQIENMFSDLALSGKQDMAWHIGDFGFEMVLSAYVPDIIREGIGKLTRRLLSRLDYQLAEMEHFAIHPGGKRILEVIEQELCLSKEDNRFAYQTLRDYGNMSSPTVLFVLKNLWQSLSEADIGKPVLSFAFGPGLTLESAVFSIAP